MAQPLVGPNTGCTEGFCIMGVLSFPDGEDYKGGTTEVEFPPGINNVTILVSVRDDDTVEMDETFTAHIVIPDTARAAGVVTMIPDVTMVTIQDDDSGWFKQNIALIYHYKPCIHFFQCNFHHLPCHIELHLPFIRSSPVIQQYGLHSS